MHTEYRLEKPSSVLLPAIIKLLINEIAGAGLQIFFHAAISNIQYGVEEWEKNHLSQINVI